MIAPPPPSAPMVSPISSPIGMVSASTAPPEPAGPPAGQVVVGRPACRAGQGTGHPPAGGPAGSGGAVLALTIPIGLLIGLTMGALGGGGAIIAVPVLVYLLGQDAREATTGSLIVVGVTALIGMWPHQRAGRARIGQGLVFGVLGGPAAYLGSRLAVGMPDAALLTAFSALLLLVAGAMTWWRRRSAGACSAAGSRPGCRRSGSTSPSPCCSAWWPPPWRCVASHCSDSGHGSGTCHDGHLSLIHISEPTRLGMISYAVFCLK